MEQNGIINLALDWPDTTILWLSWFIFSNPVAKIAALCIRLILLNNPDPGKVYTRPKHIMCSTMLSPQGVPSVTMPGSGTSVPSMKSTPKHLVPPMGVVMMDGSIPNIVVWTLEHCSFPHGAFLPAKRHTYYSLLSRISIRQLIFAYYYHITINIVYTFDLDDVHNIKRDAFVCACV